MPFTFSKLASDLSFFLAEMITFCLTVPEGHSSKTDTGMALGCRCRFMQKVGTPTTDWSK